MTKIEREKIRLGVSACLLGERVRYDGGHKRAGALLRALGDAVEWIPLCPEWSSGSACRGRPSSSSAPGARRASSSRRAVAI